MAINGDGFFVVQQPSGFANNLPVFSGSNLYTRRGDFSLNKDGYLVNGAGYHLMGIPIDSHRPAIRSGSVPQSLQFNNDALPAQVTTQIQYRVNLPRVPKTTEYNSAQPGSELLQLADYATNPLVAGGNGGVTANDASTFLSQSIGGGEITAYDTSGSPVNIQMRWAKTGSATLDGAGTFTATNAFAATTLTDPADTIAFNVSVDGGAPTAVLIDQAAVQAVGNGDNTIDTVAEFNTILANEGVTGVTASLVAGRLRLTSSTTGSSSSVAISGYTLTDANANSPDGTGIGVGTSVAGVDGIDTWELFYLENSSATGGADRVAQRRADLQLRCQHDDEPAGRQSHAQQRDDQWHRNRRYPAHSWIDRDHPVRRHQRHGSIQPAAAERVSGRRIGVDRGEQQGAHHRHLFERPDDRPRRSDPGAIQRYRLAQTARRRRFFRNRGVRPATL